MNMKTDQSNDAVADPTAVEASTEKEPTKEEIKIRKAFDDNYDSEDEEKIKMSMLKAGAKIKSVSLLYKTFMIDIGDFASKAQKTDALKVAEDVELTDEDEFNTIVKSVVGSLPGTDEKAAASLVRAWAKKHKIECFVKSAGPSRTDGFRFKFYEALKVKPNMTAEEAVAAAPGLGASENDIKAFSHFQGIREVINSVHGKAIGPKAA